MEHSGSLLSAILGLSFVLGLIFLISYLLKRFGGAFFSGQTPMRKSQLEILEIKQVDIKNRVVLAKYKSKGYLFLTGEHPVMLDCFEITEDEPLKTGTPEIA